MLYLTHKPNRGVGLETSDRFVYIFLFCLSFLRPNGLLGSLEAFRLLIISFYLFYFLFVCFDV